MPKILLWRSKEDILWNIKEFENNYTSLEE